MVAKGKSLAPLQIDVKSECRESARVVAGLDLSLRSAGVAVLFPDGRVESESFGYGLSNSTKRDQIERLILISSKIISFLQDRKVSVTGIEEYGYGSKGRLASQADLGGVIKTQVYVTQKHCPVLLPSLQIRKFLLGSVDRKSISDKQAVQLYLERKYRGPKNCDEWDALAVAVVVDAWVNRDRAGFDSYRCDVLSQISRDCQRSDDAKKQLKKQK